MRAKNLYLLNISDLFDYNKFNGLSFCLMRIDMHFNLFTQPKEPSHIPGLLPLGTSHVGRIQQPDFSTATFTTII